MIDKCAVNGTLIDFQCSTASNWYIDYELSEIEDMDHLRMEAEILHPENVTAGGFDIIDITCYSEEHDKYYSANLMVPGKLM